MFAVIQSGGKQYKVAENDVIKVEKLAAEVGAGIDLDRVLMIGGEGAPTIGTPLVAGALVTAEVLEQTRADKIIVFKKKRRKGYRRRLGHRQDLTVLRITGISADGTKKPAKKKAATKSKAPAETAAEAAPAEAAAVAEAKEKPKAKAKAPTKKSDDKIEAKTETKAKAKTATKAKAAPKKSKAKPASKSTKEKD
jgi:large subunit ribosomal protein L21